MGAIIEKTLISDPLDLLNARFLDLNRDRNYWRKQSDAINVAFSWLNGVATIATMRNDDFYSAPERTDFPKWDHVGEHVTLAKLYWNWFHWKHLGSELRLSQS